MKAGHIAVENSFIQFAEKFGSPRPLQRVLSLMRVHPKLKDIYTEECIWGGEDCSEQFCGKKYNSCKKYIGALDDYGFRLVEKKCTKIFFLNMQRNGDLSKKIGGDTLIGFCIVHCDILHTADGRDIRRSYLTETLMPTPHDNKYWITLNNYKTEILVDGRTIFLNGDYFSQQNGYTNCCAHAAIKMTTKGLACNVYAEDINEKLGIDHKSQKGNDGLNPDQICTAIESICDGISTTIIDLNGLKNRLEFLRVLYHTIESRLPVILLFKHPGHEGHAIAIIGHTFNAHSWWPYSLKFYFADENTTDIDYLPSVLWCDNFVVQDDNWGPYYLINSDFFRGVSIQQKTKEDNNGKYLPNDGMDTNFGETEMMAVLIYPKEKSFVIDGFNIEPNAVSSLYRVVDGLQDIIETIDINFKRFFYNAYQNKHLIIRTFICEKNIYLDSLKKIITDSHVKKDIENYLPEIFWISEISIPELFWANQHKVGEIIIDPLKFQQNNEAGTILIRLPFVACLIDEDNVYCAQYQQSYPHHPLIAVP